VFKKRALLAIFVSIMIAGTSTFGTLMYLDRRDYRNYLQNQYSRNLYDLMSDVENLQVSLSKVEIAGSPKRSLLLFSEIWKDANTAQYKLNSLPISHVAISQTSKFLSQVGDFCYALLKTTNNGEKLTQTEWTNVTKLKDYAGYLTGELHSMENEISQGGLKWGSIKHEGRQIFKNQAENPVNVKFESISQEIEQQYPTLIYDGPFAENVLNIKPRIVSEPEITLDKAKSIATDILGKDRIESVSIYSDKSGDRIPVYALNVKMKGRKDGNVNIDISKNGGKVVYMLDAREVGEDKLSIKDATSKGSKFLEEHGYKDMIPTFALKYDSVAVINYVFVKNKVVVYPDQIKIKVALDNGEIVGIESQHYLVAHYDRAIPKSSVTVNEAKNNISKKLKIKNIRMSIIPLESMREVYCYEFYGEYNGESYIIYINAFDGNEERILKILETPNGELTM
jgi:germination protein YpeB